MKEICVCCGKPTIYDQSTPVESRRYFIEGSGQLCESCWNELWPTRIDTKSDDREILHGD